MRVILSERSESKDPPRQEKGEALRLRRCAPPLKDDTKVLDTTKAAL